MKNLIKTYKYRFSFQDNKNNELQSQIHECWNKKDAVEIANAILANLSNSDIKKIKTKRY